MEPRFPVPEGAPEGGAKGAGEVGNDAPAPVDFARTIHYSLRAEEAPGLFLGPGGYLFVVVGSAIGFVVISLVDWLGSAFGIPRMIPMGILVGLALAVGGVTYARAKASSPKAAAPASAPSLHTLTPAAKVDCRFRLRVVGRREMIQGFASIPDEPFEPEVFFASFILAQPARAWVAGGLVAIAAAAVVLVWKGDLDSFAVMFCVLLGWLVKAFGWPVYVRVAPGRLDVMRSSAFHPRPRVVRTLDLRVARVLVETKRRTVYVQAPGGDLLRIGIAIRGDVVARAVLMGALSTAPTPPLPDDALTG